MGCKTCGGPIPVGTGRGRRRLYCDDHRPDPRVRDDKRQPVVTFPGRETGGRIESASLAELEASDRAGTADGVTALHLARLLDGGEYNAQGAAALAKAHAESMSRALKGAQQVADAVDDLRARRAARRGA